MNRKLQGTEHNQNYSSQNTTFEIIKKLPKQNFIIWIDQNIMSPMENQDHDKNLKELYKNSYKGFDNCDEALKFIKSENYEFIIICSGQVAYQFFKLTQEYDIIIYCGDKTKHSNLYLQNKRIQAIIDSKFGDVITEIEEKIQYNKNLQLFDQVFNLQLQEFAQYQHSEKHISISFFFLIEEFEGYAKNFEITKQQIATEIAKLTEPKKTLYQFTLLERIKNKELELGREMNALESFIYLYSCDHFYQKINQCLANCRYEQMKLAIKCLLQGCKKNVCQVKGPLYRGINISEEDHVQLVQKFQECMRNKTSLFWNAISSTSQEKCVAMRFINSQAKKKHILFEIQLDKTDPHPHLFVDSSCAEYKNEKEIMLFPLFEFIVVEITRNEKFNGQIYTKVLIKQQKNSFSQVFHKHKKHSYWMNDIRSQIIPYVKCISQYHFKRHTYINKNQKSLFLDNEQEFNEIQKQELIHSNQLIKNIIEKAVPFLHCEIQLENQFELNQYFTQILKSLFFNIQKKNNLKGSEIKLNNLDETLKNVYEASFGKNIQIHELQSSSAILDMMKKFVWTLVAIFFPDYQVATYVCLILLPKIYKILKECWKILLLENVTKKDKILLCGNLIINASLQFFYEIIIDSEQLFPFVSRSLFQIYDSLDIKYKCIILKVEMNDSNLSQSRKEYLEDPGISPRCVWSQVNPEVNSFILYAIEKKKILWIVPNIDKSMREIKQDCRLGLNLQNNLNYIGPKSLWSASFHILGLAEWHISPEEVRQRLEGNQLQIIQQSLISQVI